MKTFKLLIAITLFVSAAAQANWFSSDSEARRCEGIAKNYWNAKANVERTQGLINEGIDRKTNFENFGASLAVTRATYNQILTSMNRLDSLLSASNHDKGEVNAVFTALTQRRDADNDKVLSWQRDLKELYDQISKSNQPLEKPTLATGIQAWMVAKGFRKVDETQSRNYKVSFRGGEYRRPH